MHIEYTAFRLSFREHAMARSKRSSNLIEGRERRTFVFYDESEFVLIPDVLRTKAPRDKTPVFHHHYRRNITPIISCIIVSWFWATIMESPSKPSLRQVLHLAEPAEKPIWQKLRAVVGVNGRRDYPLSKSFPFCPGH
jgi:hypothetical protein